MINFVDELLFVPGGVASGGSVLLYALNVRNSGGVETVTDASLAGARWMPTYTGTVDIGRFIPNSYRPGRPYIVAVKWSGMDATLDNVALIVLPPRQESERRFISYDGEVQAIRVPGAGFEMRLENDRGWTPITTAAGTAENPDARILSFPIDWLPTGGTALVRRAAIAVGADAQFASQTTRLRLPRQPRPPRTDRIVIRPSGPRAERAFIQGFTDRMEVRSGDQWIQLDRNLTVYAFSRLGATSTISDGYLTFYVRIAPRGNTPGSAAAPFTVYAAEFTAAINDVRTTTTTTSAN